MLRVLVDQLRDFAPAVGGEQHEKVLLPLAIGLCRSECRAISESALEIIKRILRRTDIRKNEDILLETIKKLIESDSHLSKDKVPNTQYLMARMIKTA